MITSRVAYSIIFSPKMEINITMEDASKQDFHVIILFKTKFFMLDKFILKIKIHPMRSSGSNGVIT